MNEIIDRLRAALDRAEEIARAAAAETRAESWRPGGYGSGVYVAEPGTSYVAVGAWDHMPEEVAEHIAANDPSSVLRTVAAHRKIIEEFEGAAEWADTLRSEGDSAAELYARHAGTLLEVLRILAAVYFPETPDA